MNKNNLVVKSNLLNESRYKLGVVEQRIVLTMISLIKPQDRDFKPYSFTIREFSELTGVSGQNMYTRIKSMTKLLIRKSFTIKESDGDLQTGWVSSVKYYEDEGRLELMFDPKLKPYLLQLQKEFTRYQLKNTVRLRSSYSVRIYELLKQYQKIEVRIFTLDELRSLLNIPEKKLALYGNFKKKVLDIAARELKENSDIYFYYKPIKTVRKITGIEFHIKINEAVVKKSFKPKPDETKKIKEAQLELDLEQNKIHQLHGKYSYLMAHYPSLGEKLLKQAKKRLKLKDKLKRGDHMKIKFKALDLLPGFLEKEKINIH